LTLASCIAIPRRSAGAMFFSPSFPLRASASSSIVLSSAAPLILMPSSSDSRSGVADMPGASFFVLFREFCHDERSCKKA
jgi:hypothetical protein